MKKNRANDVEYVAISELKPYENNPRDYKDAIPKVAESIKRFGFNVPILVDAVGEIIAGHTRLEAAKTLGIDMVPIIRVTDLDDDLIRQYRIIDNKTAELSTWDYGLLLEELEAIPEADLSAFGIWGETDETTGDEQPREYDFSDSGEISVEEFDAEAFMYECPECGFKWNE